MGQSWILVQPIPIPRAPSPLRLLSPTEGEEEWGGR